jgi:hypothetical protein
MGSKPLSADGHAAAAAMLAVLSDEYVATDVDERLFEALLTYTLNSVPKLSRALFGVAGGNFVLGKRGRQPDVVRYRGQDVAIGIEVKIHSNLHFPKGRCQLDNYADDAPTAHLFIIVSDEKAAKLMSKMESQKYLTESRHRWKVLTLSRLREALMRSTRLESVSDDPAARLILAIARLVLCP